MTVKEKLIKIESLADKMYNAAFNMTTDASLLRKAMDDYHQFIIKEYHKEEPVSEDLEEALEEFIDSIMGHIEFNSATPFAAEYVVKLLEEAFKAGAQWQKEHSFSDPQINENIIYAKGYKQAEKDLELTWEDIKEICVQSVLVEVDLGGLVSDERHYTEVLKRFLEQKGGKV